jgi:hypothetical protein
MELVDVVTPIGVIRACGPRRIGSHALRVSVNERDRLVQRRNEIDVIVALFPREFSEGEHNPLRRSG